RILAAGTNAQAVCVWEVPSGKLLSPEGGHTTAVSALGFSSDGKTLLSGAGNAVCFWEPATGKELRRLVLRGDPPRGDTNPSCLAIAPDGKYFVCGDRTGNSVRLVDTATTEDTFELPVAGALSNVSVAFAANGKALAVPFLEFDGKVRTQSVRVWDVLRGQELARFKGPDLNQVILAQEFLALAPDGRMLALAANMQGRGGPNLFCELHVWDVGTGKESWQTRLDNVWLQPLAFAADGQLLAGASRDFLLRVWNATTGDEVLQLPGEPGQNVLQMAFSADSRLLATAGAPGDASQPGKIKLWEMASGQVRAEFSGHQAGVTALAFAPDGRL